MAMVGWLLVVALGVFLALVAVVIFFGSLAWSGRVGLEPAVPAAASAVLFVLAYQFAPFTIVMAGGAAP